MENQTVKQEIPSLIGQNELTHIDLFSGIGGFALAAQWAGFETKVFCEIDPFCQKVLKKHWPDVPIVEDIKKFNGKEWTGATLLTGGFPCQPFSVSGKRRGKEDYRYLWPEMLRIISDARPAWVLGENVAGIVRMELDSVLSDLEGIEYETQSVIIPACAINAPHRRDRVWICANSNNPKTSRQREYSRGVLFKSETKRFDVLDSNDPNPNSEYGEEHKRGDKLRYKGKEGASGRGIYEPTWEENWTEAATRLCGVANGIPNRVDRIRSLGNAIVPQVAYQILKAIVESDIATVPNIG